MPEWVAATATATKNNYTHQYKHEKYYRGRVFSFLSTDQQPAHASCIQFILIHIHTHAHNRARTTNRARCHTHTLTRNSWSIQLYTSEWRRSRRSSSKETHTIIITLVHRRRILRRVVIFNHQQSPTKLYTKFRRDFCVVPLCFARFFRIDENRCSFPPKSMARIQCARAHAKRNNGIATDPEQEKQCYKFVAPHRRISCNNSKISSVGSADAVTPFMCLCDVRPNAMSRTCRCDCMCVVRFSTHKQFVATCNCELDAEQP